MSTLEVRRSNISFWTAHPSAGVRLAAGLWITFHHVWHHYPVSPPPSTFSPLCNPFFPNSRASFLLSSSRFSPYLYICFLSIFHSLSGLLLFFLPQAPSLFSTLPPTGWAVKQERAHGRPLTSRNLASEFCHRTKPLQTFLNSHWTKTQRCSINARFSLCTFTLMTD